MDKVSLVIPAYKPDEKLLTTLREAAEHFADILVVDDGSGEEFAPIFQAAEEIPQCTLLRHPFNRGKGAALKTAITYFLKERPDFAGVVTADADGQHRTKDILAVAKAMAESGEVTLGCRDFSGADVPPKSRFGNRITIGVFRLFFGMKIRDTQTGLRAFPKESLPLMVAVEGDRYEYETQMLFAMSRVKMPLRQVAIETVYIEENRSSHFRVVRDSLRIYGLILKYLFSSAAASVVDALSFFVLKILLPHGIGAIPATFPAAFLARAISSLVNYLINAKVVFGEQTSRRSLLRYYFLVVVQITLSAAAVFLLEHLLVIRAAWLSTLIKMIVDTMLFFFSFRIQHKWVFNEGRANNPPSA